MFEINDDLSICATRGDVVFFYVGAEDNGEEYTFQPGDVLRLKIYGKKDAENVILQRDFAVTEECTAVEIYLSRDDMKLGDVISKPVEYWYSVTLNDDTIPQTIIGYDENGAKIFKLFPEGADVPAYEPTEEDIPIVDDFLDATSNRPVQNQAVTRELLRLDEEVKKLWDAVRGGA